MQPGIIARIYFLGVAAVLAVCTIRTAWGANYIRYDEATEFLVYAHGAGGVKTALGQIEEISRKTHDDLGIVVPYDQRSGWLVHWYLREYPNAYNYVDTLDRTLVDAPVVIVADYYWQQADRLLADTHYSFTYMRMWWPMMDYFDLTWERVWNAVRRSGLPVRALADLVQPRLHRIRESDRQRLLAFELAVGGADAPVRPQGSGGVRVAVRFRSLHASGGGRPVRRFGAHVPAAAAIWGQAGVGAGFAAAAARDRRRAGWIRLRGGYRQPPHSALRSRRESA